MLHRYVHTVDSKKLLNNCCLTIITFICVKFGSKIFSLRTPFTKYYCQAMSNQQPYQVSIHMMVISAAYLLSLSAVWPTVVYWSELLSAVTQVLKSGKDYPNNLLILNLCCNLQLHDILHKTIIRKYINI